MTYHIGQGNSVLGNYQSDVKGGFNGGLVPTGKSSAGISGLKETRGRKKNFKNLSFIKTLLSSEGLGHWLGDKKKNRT